MKTNVLSLMLFLAIQSIVSAHTIDLIKEQVNENDTVILVLLDYTGELQWQSSQDSISWTDLEGANSDSLLIVVKEHLYFRAKVTVGICDPFYSDVAYIENAWDIDNDSDGFTENQGDCNDTIPEISPGTIEIPNNDVDEDCDGIALIIDTDNDGYNSDEDCNDLDSLINPEALEIPNNDVDENCDGIVTIIDSDNDGYNSDEDCNDLDSLINPGAIEILNNNIDENCDGIIWIIDLDNDGYNSDEDCNDQDSLINPGAIENEFCDGIDKNCDGIDCPIDYNILNTVCGGNPIDYTSTYNADNEFYKIVLLDNEGFEHEWNINMPYYNRPNGLNEVELVACINSNWNTIETCYYDVTGLYELYRKRNEVVISIHIASTGELLDSKTFYGSYPEECLPQETFYSLTKVKKGSTVEYNDVEDWLTGVIKAPIFPTVTDYDGNVYQTVVIGEQTWMAENLKVTHYTDGTSIPLVESTSKWVALTNSDKAYCWYDNSSSYRNTYGALYTWAAAMNGAGSSDANPSGVQGVCPSSWHLPSDAEWKQLEMYLGMSQAEADATGYFRGTEEGGKLKETGTTHWNSPNRGATNSSGFTALPGGEINSIGLSSNVGNDGYWWSSSNISTGNAWRRALGNSNSQVTRFTTIRTVGFSVRCLRD